MEITTEKIEPGIERIRVQIDTTDYESDFKNELSKAAQQSNYKGFRKGKVPLGFVLRTQGQSILYNLIFKKINQILGEHLEKENVDYLFDPLPADDQTAYDFDPSKKENFVFLFDLCLPPDLQQINGWATNNNYTDYQLDVSEEQVNNRIKDFRKAHGQLVEKEEVLENDKTKLKFEVLVPNLKEEDPLEMKVEFLWEELSESFKKELKGAKPGDDFAGTLADFVVGDSQKHFISSYIQSSEMELEDTPEFSSKISHMVSTWALEEVSVFEEAEIDEDFLKKVSGSGDPINSEEELKSKVQDMISSEYWSVSRSIILKHLRQRLTDNNELTMPEKFIKEFILSGDKERELTEEVRKSTLWSVFSTTLAKEKGIQVTEEEVRSFLANQVVNWMRGMQDQQLIMSMVDRMMQDKAAQDNATENIFVNKLAGVVYDGVEKELVKLNKEEFDKLIDQEFPPADPSEEE